MRNFMQEGTGNAQRESGAIKMFVCGDFMTGRGIDQVLPHPSDPVLYVPYIRDARQYVELADDNDLNLIWNE